MKTIDRRAIIAGVFTAAGWSVLERAEALAQQRTGKDAPIQPKDNLKITKLETFLVKPRWLFLKLKPTAGIVGLGEPLREGRALTCPERVKRFERNFTV